MKKAFTLIELLVVIGIIGVLSAVLLGTFSKASESALSASCLVNMRSLATAWQTACAQDSGYNFPASEPSECAYPVAAKGNQFKNAYIESPGWISWDSRGLYENHRADSTQEASCKRVGIYSCDYESVQFALSNGILYKHLSGSTSAYVCPVHKKKRPDANWSYLMNGTLTSAKALEGKLRDRLLLFAEVPFLSNSPGAWFPVDRGEGWSTELDAALQVDGETPENIGVNHKVGNEWVAHVAFTDGHVEKLRIGKNMSGDAIRELSMLLVEGTDITYNAGGNKYEEIK